MGACNTARPWLDALKESRSKRDEEQETGDVIFTDAPGDERAKHAKAPARGRARQKRGHEAGEGVLTADEVLSEISRPGSGPAKTAMLYYDSGEISWEDAVQWVACAILHRRGESTDDWERHALAVREVLTDRRWEQTSAGWSEDERILLDRLRAGEAVVVNMSKVHGHPNLVGWAKAAELFVRIDRRTEWGNPFVAEPGKDGDRKTVIRKYEDYLPRKPSLQQRRGELRGKALGCWCAPSPCHGDVLKAWAEDSGDGGDRTSLRRSS